MSRAHKIWLISAILLVLSAAWFRFDRLDLKPIHHDESVNYSFTKKLVNDFNYAYNPSAYHGPFLYFIGMPAAWLAGYSKTAMRFTPSFFGLLAVIFLLAQYRLIGRQGALLAAAMLALSPADVYFSRTFIHEVYFSFATAGMFWTFLAAARRVTAANVVGFWIFLTVAFAVKETASINVMAFGAAMIVLWLWSVATGRRNEEFEPRNLFHGQYLLWAAGLSLTVWILLFTSFLTNPNGIVDFFKAYLPWLDTGFREKPHAKPWTYFFILLGKYYLPALPFAAWAIVRGLWKRQRQTIAQIVIALVTLDVYSHIPYKTPWCVLTIGLSWIMLSAVGFTDLWELARPLAWRITFSVLILAGLTTYGLASYRLNFEEYDDDDYKIVYVQTLHGYEEMLPVLTRVAATYQGNKDLPIFMTFGAKNPGRPYLHHYKGLRVQKDELPDKITAPVVIVRSSEYDELAERLIGDYHSETYPVFPGWWIYLLVKEDLWQKTFPATATD